MELTHNEIIQKLKDFISCIYDCLDNAFAYRNAELAEGWYKRANQLANKANSFMAWNFGVASKATTAAGKAKDLEKYLKILPECQMIVEA